MATQELTKVLDSQGVEYELLPHAHTESALAEAHALALDPTDVAKTIVVDTPKGHVRAVLPASERLDLGKLSEFLGFGRKEIQLVSEGALARDYPEFDLGAVPPIGGSRQEPVVMDSQIAERESIVLEAGSHEESIRVAREALLKLTGAKVADITQD
jgi:Ala-tRNA(Pro) deacylase